jgi:hypothetical protein
MNIEELTLKQIREIQSLLRDTKSSASHPYEIGKNYIVRTVTMIFTGRLVEVTDQELILVDAAWIPETDRYMQFVENGSIKECEPYPDGRRLIIGRGALLDAVVLEKDLPRFQK